MIQTDGLTLAFAGKTLFENVNVKFTPGNSYGLIGANGAGKSTTMRMITGYITPDSGDAILGDHSIVDEPEAAKSIIGYLPENAPSYPDMDVQGFLRFAAEIRGMDGTERDKSVDQAIEVCSLESVRRQNIDTLSKGFTHRTCLAQSILHDPEVLILDEPTDGLDPNQKHDARQLIKRLGETKAIIFSTHILEEVEAACSRAIIIDQGRIVANGTPEELKKQSKTNRLDDLFRELTVSDTKQKEAA